LRDVDLVIHLAAAVSGECERDLDVGLTNNLDASRALFDACRGLDTVPVVVFASSVAAFGSVPGQPMPEVIVDSTMPVPRSSYGTQKVMVEYLLSDYSRRKIVRGRTVRLMTVTVRPGRPNAAASSFVSGIIREPLNGERSVCPVGPDTKLAVSSPRRSIEGLLLACTAPDEAWGPATAVNLPALTVTPREMAAAMDRVAGRPASDLIEWAIDAAVVNVVASWPSRFRTDRATALGLTAEPDFDTIVRNYLDER
jgi:nucleoside-diphosphate-sugar epimerase